MTIDPVKIPQNVYIEDRIVGPLTLRQIIIMAVGGGFSYMLYALVQRTYGHVSIPLTVILWTPAALSAAFALVNINDLSLLRICFLLVERMVKPGQRTWAARTGISITIRTSAKPQKDEKQTVAAPAATPQQQIAELTQVVDRTAPMMQEPTVETMAITSEPQPQPVAKMAPTPVNASDISVDPHAHPAQLSDLSIFRDVLPPSATWPA